MNRNRTAAERVEKWNRRYTADHVKTIIDNEKPTFLQNNTASTNDLVAHEQATKTVLNDQGVSVALVADYLSFSRQVWKLKGIYSGETLRKAVATRIGTWVDRNLAQPVLEAIRDTVYTIGAPTP